MARNTNKIPMYMSMALVIIVIANMAILLSHCATSDFVIPKPRAYFRIEPYDTVYREFDKLPLTLMVNDSARCTLVNDSAKASGSEWINIYYPRYKATLFCSYLPVTRKSLRKHIDNRMQRIILNAGQEIPRNIIFEDTIRNMSASVYFTSSESISPLQFIATDSTSYLFSGALYFNDKVKEDSISPVIDYITDDVIYMLQTIKPSE
jgi:gliding motility-associated lipoprotein gldD